MLESQNVTNDKKQKMNIESNKNGEIDKFDAIPTDNNKQMSEPYGEQTDGNTQRSDSDKLENTVSRVDKTPNSRSEFINPSHNRVSNSVKMKPVYFYNQTNRDRLKPLANSRNAVTLHKSVNSRHSFKNWLPFRV
ncbi:MAG: hypothetical protein ABW168_04975 [Sedimenticola sp.]